MSNIHPFPACPPDWVEFNATQRIPDVDVHYPVRGPEPIDLGFIPEPRRDVLMEVIYTASLIIAATVVPLFVTVLCMARGGI